MIIIPIKWLFHWEYTLFSDKPIWENDDEALDLEPHMGKCWQLAARLQEVLHPGQSGKGCWLTQGKQRLLPLGSGRSCAFLLFNCYSESFGFTLW